MSRILNVAEKNDAAKELSKIMSGGRAQRREGFSKFNKIYEFDFNILGMNSQMIMTSVSGHLLSLDFILAYKNWNNCAPVSLFTADIRRYCPDNYIPIKRTLEREIKGCQHLILWTDGDREGENIADEIVQVCTAVRKRVQIHRARFSEITTQSIMRACNNLGVLDERVSNAVKVRQELDLRVGCAFTRFQTKRLTKAFPQVLMDQLVSYGPCQFPTLGFVVERYKQVQAFMPETFYKIKVTHETQDDKVDFNWKRVRVFSHTVCLILYQICLESPTARVLGTQSRPRSKWRPLPLDTVELEKLASRKLRINAKETMKIAEKLYTQGFISYPRTETNIFPDSFNLPDIIGHHTGDPQWGGFAAQLLARGPTPRRGSKTDNAHPPIHPTKYTNTLQGDEKRIYEFVVRHFLACCSQDAQGQETTVDIEVAGEKFAAQGLMIIARNYLEVYPYDRWSDKTIPVYQQNSTFEPTSIEMIEGETAPPPLLQEADLIALMEKHGIGTDATHAEHIETIKSRNYVGVQADGSFIPGELGMGLVEGYDSMGFDLSKPRLRAELESDLKRICEGTKVKEEVLEETVNKYRDVFVNASQQAHKLEEALSHYFGVPQIVTADAPPVLSDAVRKCPFCQQCDMVVKRKKNGGFMLTCLGFPECRSVQFFPTFVTDANLHDTFCHTCQPQPVHMLQLKFAPGSIPPYLGLDYVGCTTCDETLNGVGFSAIRLTNPAPNSSGQSRNQSQSQTSRQRATTRTSTPRAGRTTSRGRGRGSPRSARAASTQSQSTSTRGRGRGRGSSSQRGSSRTLSSQDGQSNWNWGPGPPPPGSGGGGVGNSVYSDGGMGSNDHSHSSLNSSNPPVCNCGQPPVLLTVRREDSANKGRQFYKCDKREGGCDFFLWADQAMTTVRDTSTASGYGSMVNPPVCNCGQPPVLLTVRREDSANKGRQFYKCDKRDGGCDFFLWADQAMTTVRDTGRTSTFASSSGYGSMVAGIDPSGSNVSRFSSEQQRPGASANRGDYGTNYSDGGGATSSGFGSGDNMTVMCNCASQAVLRTVQKEGANKGRQFYTCPKPREEQCGFYEWADDMPASTSHTAAPSGRQRGSGSGGARPGRNTGVQSGGTTGDGKKKRAPPTCSVCRQQGHTKRSCPQA